MGGRGRDLFLAPPLLVFLFLLTLYLMRDIKIIGRIKENDMDIGSMEEKHSLNIIINQNI